jgi:hypothetical protein
MVSGEVEAKCLTGQKTQSKTWDLIDTIKKQIDELGTKLEPVLGNEPTEKSVEKPTPTPLLKELQLISDALAVLHSKVRF